MQDYWEAFRRSSTVKGDQPFILCEQMFDFIHRLLYRIFSGDCLPKEVDWEALLGLIFTNIHLQSTSLFMEKTDFRTKAMRSAKERFNVEMGKKKQAETNGVDGAVMGDMFNPHADQGRAYIPYVCKEPLKHPTIRSDLVASLVCIDYCALFMLPRSQVADCLYQLFHSFFVRG